MAYYKQDKTQKLARPYGVHAIHSGNGKLIESEATANGSSVNIKARLALGESSLSEVERLTYDGIDIAAANWNFYKDSGLVTPASTMFPTRALSAGASFIDYQLPPGMNVDGQPDKAVARVKCLEIADYNAQGTQIGFGYSNNAARVAADAIIHLTDEPGLIEWAAWADFKAFTAGNITITVDGANVQAARFPLNFFLIPPFDLEHFLDRVCQLTCSDWIWANGKIRFLPAIDRAASFAFTPSNLSRAYKFQAVAGDAKFNGVRVSWRDENSPLLIEQKPIEIDRRASQNEPENFYEINAATCRRDVAERIGYFNARVKCDLNDFAFLRSSPAAYPVLPGDIVTVTHPTPAWTNKRCKVLKKTEREDRETKEGEEVFKGYGVYVRLDPTNPYSDTDTTPLVTRQAVAGLNPYAAPPVPTMTFLQQIYTGRNGVIERQIIVNVQFGAFGFSQRGKVLWAKPGQGYQFYNDLTPDAANQSTFVVPNAPAGDNFFKVIAYSDLGVQQSGLNDSLVTVTSLNTELTTPVIEQLGESTLDAVIIGVKNYSEKVRYRLIQVSLNSNFPNGSATLQWVHSFNDTVNLFGAREKITRTFSNAQQTKYVRVAHSTNNVDFTNWSAPLEIIFKNEANEGVPTLIDKVGKVFNLVGGSWFFEFPPPLNNGGTAQKIQFRLLNDTKSKFLTYPKTATDFYFILNDTAGLPANGKMWAAETVTYGGINGNDIINLTRGVEGSDAIAHPAGDQIYLIEHEINISFTEDYTFPALGDNYHVHWRVLNHYRGGDSDGWSRWAYAGYAYGTNSIAANQAPPEASAPPAPPPAVEPPPPVGYEDPYDPEYCFAPSEEFPVFVWMADGSSKNIQDLQRGELVKCRLDGQIVNRPVTHLFRNRTDGFYNIESDDCLPVTGRHPFYTAAGIVRVRHLFAGDKLICWQAGWCESSIIAATRKLTNRYTYNHEVAEAHNYFVRGTLTAKWKLVGNMRAKNNSPYI